MLPIYNNRMFFGLHYNFYTIALLAYATNLFYVQSLLTVPIIPMIFVSYFENIFSINN